jgi:hypothetical protein
MRRAAIRRRFEQPLQKLRGFLVSIGDFDEEGKKFLFSRQEAHGSSRTKGGEKIAALENGH